MLRTPWGGGPQAQPFNKGPPGALYTPGILKACPKLTLGPTLDKFVHLHHPVCLLLAGLRGAMQGEAWTCGVWPAHDLGVSWGAPSTSSLCSVIRDQKLPSFLLIGTGEPLGTFPQK